MAFRHVPQCDPDGRCRNDRADDKDRPPRRIVDQPTAEQRPRRCTERGKTRPSADGTAAFVLLEGGAEDCQRIGDQQGSADTLHGPRHNELQYVRRESAPDRRQRERDDTDIEKLAAAEMIAGRAANQDERGET